MDIGALTGGGPGGRITAADVEAARTDASPTATPGEERLTLSSAVRTAALDALAEDIAATVETDAPLPALRAGILAAALDRTLSFLTLNAGGIAVETATHHLVRFETNGASPVDAILAAAGALAPGSARPAGGWLLADYGDAGAAVEAARLSPEPVGCVTLSAGATAARTPRSDRAGRLILTAKLERMAAGDAFNVMTTLGTLIENPARLLIPRR